MEIVLTTQVLLGAGLVFLLRVTDMSLDTLRVRGRNRVNDKEENGGEQLS